MSKIPRLPRETIAVVGAIVGANLISFATQSKPVQSLDCFQPFAQVKQAVTNALPSSQRESDAPRGAPIGSYYDVRLKKDVPYYREGEAPSSQTSTQVDVPLATVSTATPVLPTVHTPTAHLRTQGIASTPRVSPLTMTDAEIDAAIAQYTSRGGY